MTEIPDIYQLTNVGTAPRFNKAFQQGVFAVEHLQPNIITDGVRRPGPIALWGEHKWFRVLHKAIAEGVTWYYGDHAYFGRNFYYRITKNALQVSGRFPMEGEAYDANLRRFATVSKALGEHKLHDEIKIHAPRWVKDGFILVCPPSEPLSERSGFTQKWWTDKVVSKLRRQTKREIIVRQKPKVNHTPAPLLQALEGAYCAVTYTSNVATEAMLGGYPCFTTGPHPANVFGNTTLDTLADPKLPEPYVLQAWVANLCANQWTLAEIASGMAWEALNK